MEWLDKILEGVENATELAKKISTELPKHFKPAGVFNETNDKLKAAKLESENAQKRIDEMQVQIDELSKSGGTIEELTKKLKETSEANEKFKADTLAAEAKRTKDAALEKVLRSDEFGVDEKLLQLIKKDVDYEKITVGATGELVGLTEVAQVLKTEYPTAFTITTQKGTPPGKPSGKVTTKQQLIDQYNDAEKSGNTRAMAALHVQIKNFKE